MNQYFVELSKLDPYNITTTQSFVAYNCITNYSVMMKEYNINLSDETKAALVNFIQLLLKQTYPGTYSQQSQKSDIHHLFAIAHLFGTPVPKDSNVQFHDFSFCFEDKRGDIYYENMCNNLGIMFGKSDLTTDNIRPFTK